MYWLRMTTEQGYIRLFQSARRDPQAAVLEGLHAVKHARRFGAGFRLILAHDPAALERLCLQLCPDVAPWLTAHLVPVSEATFARLSPAPIPTGVIALADRRQPSPHALLAGPRRGPLVLLENPSHLGNVGAAIRVAAGAGAGGVITSGPHDPWHPSALRGAAGLQYAVPVTRIDDADLATLRQHARGPLLAIHPEGETLTPASVADDAILVFGSERRGISDTLLAQCDARLRIPMTPGVSSLNLATAVAVTLYSWRLNKP